MSPRPLTLWCMAVQAREAAFVKALKREGVEWKGLQATGGILIKINKLNCSAFQAKQWETNCLLAEWEASSQTAYQQAVNETLVFWESLSSRHKVSKRSNNCILIPHPPFQAPPHLTSAKVSLSFFWFHIILRCLYNLVVADMQSDCCALNRNALKHHLLSFFDISLYSTTAQLHKPEILVPIFGNVWCSMHLLWYSISSTLEPHRLF